MEWILIIILVIAIYNAEKLPSYIKQIKNEVPHIVDAGKKATKEIKDKAKQVQEKNNKKNTSKNAEDK